MQKFLSSVVLKTEHVLSHSVNHTLFISFQCTVLLLLDHLRLIASHCERNKMTPQGLAMAFGPVLMCHAETPTAIVDIRRPIDIMNFLVEMWPNKRSKSKLPSANRAYHLLLSAAASFCYKLGSFSRVCSFALSFFLYGSEKEQKNVSTFYSLLFRICRIKYKTSSVTTVRD